MTRDLMPGLVFFVLSSGYFVMSMDIPLYFGDEDAPFNAQTFPYLLGILGMATSALMIFFGLRPRAESSDLPSDHSWAPVGYMCILMIGFGVALGIAGFFLATVLFLGSGLVLLGERRPLIIIAVPLAAATAFAVLLHGILGIYMDDPLLAFLGLI